MNEKPTAFITGASRGIGRAIVIKLAKQGFNIAALSRTLESSDNKIGLADLKPIVEEHGVNFLPIKSDISEIDSHDKSISDVHDEYGRLDILVNNAGVAPLTRDDILFTDPGSYDRVMGINLRGSFFFTQKVVRYMLDCKSRIENYNSKIVFITSVSAELSSINRVEYCISKAGLSMAAKVFADRLASEGVTVYEIRPGIIETDMTSKVKDKYSKMIADGLVPQGGMGKPEDVANVVSAIARGDFDYSTGICIEVSGGMNIKGL